MKEFFKRNILIISLFVVGIVLFFVSTVIGGVILPISLFLIGTPLILLSFRFKKKYKEKTDYDEKDNVLDYSKLNYDEDVYYFETDNKKVKGALSKFSLMTPFVACLILGIAFFVLGITSIVQIFF